MWEFPKCSKENNDDYQTRCESPKPVKVYVGRRSLYMGDDCNAPNMFSFFLNDNIDEVKYGICKGLPCSLWTVYAGSYSENDKYGEDGVIVCYKANEFPLFRVEYGSYGNNPIFQVLNNEWYSIIKKHPYLYCE